MRSDCDSDVVIIPVSGAGQAQRDQDDFVTATLRVVGILSGGKKSAEKDAAITAV